MDILVFPAASKPSISSLISLLPKILPIILEMEPPIVAVSVGVYAARANRGRMSFCDRR